MADRALLQRPIAQSCIRGHGHSDGGSGASLRCARGLYETTNNGNGTLMESAPDFSHTRIEIFSTIRPSF